MASYPEGVDPDAGDGPDQGVYHFLDVGGAKYGECTLVQFGDTRILIDGAHPQDFRGQQGYDSLPEQLSQILGGEPPFDIDILVVTHGHSDHIGCLPELISNDIIHPRFALLTDPRLGFGRTMDEDLSSIDTADPATRLAAVLREEDVSDLDDSDLQAFIDTVARVEQRYANLIADLRRRDVDITFYRGQAVGPELAAALAPTGATLLGPSRTQLLLCAEQISQTNTDARASADSMAMDSPEDVAQAYRRLIDDNAEADSRNPRGSGMNCQSITLAFGPPGARALLAGDMQFTEPGVDGAEGEMAELRNAVVAAGPYKLFKTTHHTSHNGQDDAFLTELGSPPLIVHCGGLRDESHPYPRLLGTLSRRRRIRFARTDHNGLITVRPSESPASAIEVSRGAINDFEPNIEPDLPAELARAQGEEPAVAPAFAAPAAQIVIVNLPPGTVDLRVAGVEIQVRPIQERRQAAAIETRGETGGGRSSRRRPRPSVDNLSVSVAPGRSIAGLLFVTDPAKLRRNIGREEADAALAAIRAAGGEVLEGAANRLAEMSADRMRRRPRPKGVVLLGGYDVVPSRRTDVLGADLRNRLGGHVGNDADQFWVWSDSVYGDLDGDAIAEIPVSRIPDARDWELFFAALGAQALQPQERFGVRNVVREFANDVWQEVPGATDLKVSEQFVASDIEPQGLRAQCHYFMLHGAEEDGREFTGEYVAGGYPVAFDVDKVPRRFTGLVFTGCCWGGLIVDGKAATARVTPAPRLPENSIALSYLKAGALGFVGCTGAHYSGPSTDRDVNYAARLHRAFWRALPQADFAPAPALHQARNEYARSIVRTGHGLDPVDTARRLKNYAQFTCLGLGW